MFLKKSYILTIIAFLGITFSTYSFVMKSKPEINFDFDMVEISGKSKISQIKEDVQLFFEILSEMTPKERYDFVKDLVASHISENKRKYIAGTAFCATAIAAYIYFHNSK